MASKNYTREQRAEWARKWRAKRAEEFADEWCNAPPTRIVRPASECAPIVVRTPTSVFQLALY